MVSIAGAHPLKQKNALNLSLSEISTPTVPLLAAVSLSMEEGSQSGTERLCERLMPHKTSQVRPEPTLMVFG